MAKVKSFGWIDHPWLVPTEDVQRQATASIRGYVYQLHQSAAAWIALDPDDLLYLEVAEDFAEIIRSPGQLEEILSATQVKDTRESGAVTLNSEDVISAIEALFRLRQANVGRGVRLKFLTTSKIGSERKLPLRSGMAGLIAWKVAADGGDVEEIREALLARFESSEVRTFVEVSTPQELREVLLQPLTFECGELNWRVLEEQNRNALIALRGEVRATADMAHRAYDAIFGHIVKAILTSGERRLDRSGLIASLERATTIAVPSQDAVGLISGMPTQRSVKPLEIQELKRVAQELLELGRPPSIELLLPSASPAALSALKKVMIRERFVTEIDARGAARSSISGLARRAELKHFIVGPPGLGKTYAMWRTAMGILEEGSSIPLFLTAAQLHTWAELLSLLADIAPHVEPAAILGDPRILVCIDGWSEFASGEHTVERSKALRALRNTRVIANGKRVDATDSAFKHWALEGLAAIDVEDVVRSARPENPVPTRSVLDLLRLPLLLSIYALSGLHVSNVGELLRQFHEHLASDLPVTLTDALAGAAADVALTEDRSFGLFASNFRKRSASQGLVGSIPMLKRLGTISERGGQVLPIHDLYWSWLVGLGLLARGVSEAAIDQLHTRESYKLALQSGMRPSDYDVNAMVKDDLVLAATLWRGRVRDSTTSQFLTFIDLALGDTRLSVRCRGAVAALELGASGYLGRVLTILSEADQATIYQPEWARALRPEQLFLERAALTTWLGSPGSELVLDVIAERGGPEWLSWLKQVMNVGALSGVDALATVLACTSEVPDWADSFLDELIDKKPWTLRAAASRRSNVALAQKLANNYERFVDNGHSNAWMELNRVLVACGDDSVFGNLLERFGSMGARAQELLGYAIVGLGESWIAAFQRVAFAVPGTAQHHKISEVVSSEIDDTTARKWIEAGYEDLGWRILISRHGSAIVPEMIARLPRTLADVHHVPVLAAMRFLKDSPNALLEAIWSRIESPMQPKAMQDVLNALVTVHPTGMPSIVNFVIAQPSGLPAYHLDMVVRLYEDWRNLVGDHIYIRVDDTETPFHKWISGYSVAHRWEDHFTPRMLARFPDLAVEFVLVHLQSDETRAMAVLKEMNELNSYSEALLDYMLKVPGLAALVPSVFAQCFDTFPAAALHRCIDSMDVDQEMLLYRLRETSNPLHFSVHGELISRAFNCPLNMHRLRSIAGMLRGHTKEDVLLLLESAPRSSEDRWIWLAREVEVARGERLIDEVGQIRR